MTHTRTGRYPSVMRARDAFDRFALIVGGRIRDARLERGLSLFELANAAGVQATAIRVAENGRPASLGLIYRVARAMRLDARELLP